MDKETERLRIINLFRGALTNLEAIINYEEFKQKAPLRLRGILESLEQEKEAWIRKN